MPRTRLFLLPLLACAAIGSAIAQDAGSEYAIVGINVIPMDEEGILDNQTVVIADGEIQSIGDTASTTLAADILQVSGNDQYLIPGLADLHIHLAHEDELLNYLSWGMTTVMHLGGSSETGQEILEYREQIEDGTRLGPNIITTGRILDGDPAVATGAMSISSAEEARQAVLDLKSAGFDFAKIYNNVSQPVFEAIIDEAQRQGIAVIGHIPRGFDALAALGSGQNAVVHTEEFFFTYFEGPRSTEKMTRDYQPDYRKLPTLIEVLAGNNVAVMPDLSFTFTNLLMWDELDHVWQDREFDYLHPATASMWEGGNINRRAELENHIVRDQWKYNLMQRLIRDFQEAGILQVIGTDASLPGLFPGEAAHRELTELVKAGLSNFDALAIGSSNAGEFVRRYIDDEVRVGLVKPGYRADLVLLNSNPLDDVRNARDISAVVVNGRLTKKSELDERRAALLQRYDYLRDLNTDVDVAMESADAGKRLQKIVRASDDDEEALETIESRINAAGYAAAFAGEFDRSEFLLEINTRLFPNSANTWDSLAELTHYRGDKDRALQLYRKALQADPSFGSAKDAIERIQRDEAQ